MMLVVRRGDGYAGVARVAVAVSVQPDVDTPSDPSRLRSAENKL